MYDPVGKLFTLRKISEIVGTWGMFIEPYLVLFLYPFAGSVITVTGQLKFLLRNSFGKVKAFYIVPYLNSDLFLWCYAEAEIIEFHTTLAAAVFAAHIEVFKFGNLKFSSCFSSISPAPFLLSKLKACAHHIENLLIGNVGIEINRVPMYLVHMISGDNTLVNITEKFRIERLAFKVYNVFSVVKHNKPEPFSRVGVAQHYRFKIVLKGESAAAPEKVRAYSISFSLVIKNAP